MGNDGKVESAGSINRALEIEAAALNPTSNVKDFITKATDEREQFETGMQRSVSTEKARFDLIVPADQPYNQTMLYRHAALMDRGARVYGPRNWEKARTQVELDRFKESAFRHFMAWYSGETDEDHAAAVFFNITGAEYVVGRMKENNDAST